MSESKVYPVKAHIGSDALLDKEGYEAMYLASVQNPDAFWGEQGKILDWMTPYTRVKNTSYDPGHVSIKWYEDGLLNVSANCLDRHLAQRGDKVAIIWEGDNPAEDRKLTYRELHGEVCKFANVLKAQGVKRGDMVCLYMPMVPEAAIAMLACTRIGAVHSIVFGGFSPEALSGRIIDSGSSIVITADEGLRGGRPIPLKKNVDEALTHPDTKVNKVIVLKRTGGKVAWHDHRDIWWHDAVAAASPDCPPEAMSAEDPLFVLYTSGSTGKPKGAMISYRNIRGVVPGIVDRLELSQGTTHLSYLPLCHVAEQMLTSFVPVYIGSQVNFGESIRTVQEDLREVAPTMFLGVPRIWEKLHAAIHIKLQETGGLRRALFHKAYNACKPLAEKPRSAWSAADKLTFAANYWLVFRALQNFIGLRNAHVALTGAAPIPPDVVRFFRVLGVPLIEVYGLTESTGMVTGHRLDHVVVGTVGVPTLGVEHRIADNGELQLNSHVMDVILDATGVVRDMFGDLAQSRMPAPAPRHILDNLDAVLSGQTAPVAAAPVAATSQPGEPDWQQLYQAVVVPADAAAQLTAKPAPSTAVAAAPVPAAAPAASSPFMWCLWGCSSPPVWAAVPPSR